MAEAEKESSVSADPMAGSESMQSRQLSFNDDYNYNYDNDDYYADDPPPARRRGGGNAMAQQRRRQQRLLAQQRMNLLRARAVAGVNRRVGSAASNSYGSFSHGHGHHKECDNGIPLALLLTTLLGVGVLFFTLFTKITMATGRRRKRSEMSDEWEQFHDGLATIDADGIFDLVYGGRLF